MSGGRIPPDLTAVIRHTRGVLLDFDGPVCPIFDSGVNAEIAAKLRQVLRNAHPSIPRDLETTHDPLEVLRFSYQAGRSGLVENVDDAFRVEELEAARTAVPTPGAHDAIRECAASGRPIVIVSNNDPKAIATYLDQHRLSPFISAVVGRAYGRPDLMKPHPSSVHQALEHLQLPATACTLVGDSLTDIEVARNVGTRSIGYAKRPERRPGLEQAGADVVIDTMTTLADAFRQDERSKQDGETP